MAQIQRLLRSMQKSMAFFEQFLKEGKDVLHVTLSSGISGTVNSARIAMDELKEKYPERKIMVIDSTQASSGYGLYMDKLADLRDEGMEMEELAKWAEDNKNSLNSWFFSTDLTFFIKGGRVSKTSGFIGNVLNICPMMNVNSEGKLVVRSKIRTKKKAFKEIVDIMEQQAIDGLDYTGKVYMSHSACIEDAKAVAELIESRFTKMNGKVEINDIGTTIGSHTGPGTVALVFWGKERTL